MASSVHNGEVGDGGWVTVGTSQDAEDDPALVESISAMVCEAYGYRRLDTYEVISRLRMGDAGTRSNRVLHLAWRKLEPDGPPKLVGCCSSTVQPPWTESGCGHWGLLVVDTRFQGSGVGSLLVAAAEARLASRSCSQIQIEYEYTCGDPYSERLAAWYEGKCGFSAPCPLGSRPGSRQFRRCRKRVKKGGTSPRVVPANSEDAAACQRQKAAVQPPAGGRLSRLCPMLVELAQYLLPSASWRIRLSSPRGEATSGEQGDAASRESASRGAD